MTQTQIDEANGMDFASSLQHAMRHDPDVIVLGDIPDRATAKLVMDACMQGGFRVVAGFNSATVFETVEGLIDRGFDRDQLGYILSGVCMQRLVRRICPIVSGQRMRHVQFDSRSALRFQRTPNFTPGWLRSMSEDRLSRSRRRL